MFPGSVEHIGLGLLGGSFSVAGVLPANEDVVVSGAPDGLSVEVVADAVTGQHDLDVFGEVCYAPDSCVGATASIEVEVLEISKASAGAEPEFGFTEPSNDRQERAVPYADTGSLALSDEVLVVMSPDLGPDDAMTAAETLAATNGAVVTGAYPDLGVFELRWASSGDIEARVAGLVAEASVEAAVPTLLDGAEDGGRSGVSAFMSADVSSLASPSAYTDAVTPDDWKVPLLYDYGWPLRSIRAPEAWQITTGRGSAALPDGEPVGVVDMGVAQKNYGVWSTNVSSPRTSSAPNAHATHVAGTACSSPQAGGNVGVAWRCRTYHTGVVDGAWKNVLAAAEELIGRTHVRVVNMSLASPTALRKDDPRGCARAARRSEIRRSARVNAPLFETLFSRGRGASIVWTLAAGNNCMSFASSAMAQHWSRDNVVTVASSNADGQLSSFSNFGEGVEVAAPGGVDGEGRAILSTMVDDEAPPCPSSCYGVEHGTSMAAPAVAGMAQLLFTARPDLRAAQVGRCIVGTATQKIPSHSAQPSGYPYQGEVPYVSNSLREVDARAALECGLSQSTTAPSAPTNVVADAEEVYGFSGGSRYLAYRTGYQLAVADLQTGTSDVVSVDNDGRPAAYGDAGHLSVSDNGRWSVFSSASPLGIGANDRPQVWLHDTLLASTTLISSGPSGPSNYGSQQPAISGDGRFVSFLSHSTNLGAPPGTPDGSSVVYVLDRSTGTLRHVAATTGGVFNLSMSRSGSTLSFTTRDNLLPTDTDFQNDAYVVDRQSGALRLVSPPSQVTRDVSSPVRLSGNGRFAAYWTFSRVPVATARDLFVHDAWTGRTVAVPSRTGMWLGGTGLSLSDDGRRVVAVALTDEDLPMQPASNDRTVVIDVGTSSATVLADVPSVSVMTADGSRVAHVSDRTAYVADVPR